MTVWVGLGQAAGFSGPFDLDSCWNAPRLLN